MDFSENEKVTIASFFNKLYTEDLFELSDTFVLETGTIDHPIGDRLAVHPKGYTVTFAEDPKRPVPLEFPRNSNGLLAALHTLEDA